MNRARTQRNSGIETLKLAAIFLIVISHVVQTLMLKNAYIPYADYRVRLSGPTDNLQILILSMLRYNGELGNTIFFVCSAWFFLENDRVSKKKILLLLADIWVISVLILIFDLIHGKGQLCGSLIVTALLPSTFQNNWFMTCYLMFYALHPLWNKLIRELPRKTLFRLIVVAGFLYFGIAFSSRILVQVFNEGSAFFSSRLVMWTVIYFIMGYGRRFHPEFSDRRKAHALLAAIGLIGNFGLVWAVNLIDLKTGLLKGANLVWLVIYNPFLIALSLGLFHLAKQADFRSAPINYLSGLSMFVYLIHENRLIRTFYRPAMWQAVYLHYGYSHILLWTLALSLAIFLLSLLFSAVYQESVHRLVVSACDRIYPRLAQRWVRWEKRIFKE